MANVTYLLGAGASANCLPTYLNFFERFQKFGEIFKETNPSFKSLASWQKNDANSIKTIADEILKEFQFHNTPDTIAKKYFHSLNGSPKLRDLKEILILFFLHQQILNQKDSEKKPGDLEFKQSVDKRYDAFIASLLKPIRGNLKLYDEFKILTWNYDLQFEIAYSRYQEQRIPFCQKQIQSYPRILFGENENFDLNKFGIVHLNGIAYARGNSFTGYKDFLGDFFHDDQFVLPYLTDVYHSIRTGGITEEIGGDKLLSFAWEKQKEDQSIIEDDTLKNAFGIADQTQILVIVGYSFPIFNSYIDKNILQKMTQLKAVYIQSPNSSSIKNILLEFAIINPDKIKDVGYYSQFYIPSEWNRSF